MAQTFGYCCMWCYEGYISDLPPTTMQNQELETTQSPHRILEILLYVDFQLPRQAPPSTTAQKLRAVFSRCLCAMLFHEATYAAVAISSNQDSTFSQYHSVVQISGYQLIRTYSTNPIIRKPISQQLTQAHGSFFSTTLRESLLLRYYS